MEPAQYNLQHSGVVNLNATVNANEGLRELSKWYLKFSDTSTCPGIYEVKFVLDSRI